MCYRSSCPIKIWTCILAPAVTGLMVPFFWLLGALEVSTPSPSGLIRSGWMVSDHTTAFSVFSITYSNPGHWQHFLNRETCSSSSFVRNRLCLSPFTALWCNASPWLPLERLGPRPAHLKALSYYCWKTMEKHLHLSQDHPPNSSHQCVWSRGALLPTQSSPPCWYVSIPTYTWQVLSLPLGDRASRWVVWLSVFKI